MRAEFAKPYGDSAALAVRAELLASSGVEQTVVGALELLPREEETVICIYALTRRTEWSASVSTAWSASGWAAGVGP